MIVTSFRARLTLWNVAILGLVMSGLVFVLIYRLRTQELAAFDESLVERTRFFEGIAFKPEMEPPEPSFSDPRAREPQDIVAERKAWFAGPRIVDPDGRLWGLWGPWWNRPRYVPWDWEAYQEALQGRRIYSTTSSRYYDLEQRIRVYSVPVRRDGQILGVVQLAQELGEFDQRWQSLIRFVLFLLPFALLIAAIGGLFLTDRALKPIHSVTQTAELIGEQDLSRRLSVRGNDELAALATTFNKMIERLEAAFHSRAVAYARLESAYEQQKRFTADASHELRTPLTRIKTATSGALNGEQSPQEYEEALRIADRAADTMTRLIDQLLTLARADAGQLRLQYEEVDLVELLQDAGAMVRTDASLVFDLPTDAILLPGDGDLLSRVFLNLVENAARHTPAAGRITLSADVSDEDVVVRVEDTGEGIGSEHLPHLFDRFYRADLARNRRDGGTGLGLAICQSIVHAHGGTITIASQPGQGTQVTVILPRKVPAAR